VIEKVASRRGDEVRHNTPVGQPVLSEEKARLLTSILESVVRAGTGRRAAIPGVPVAGKTGTTDDYGDAWFVGYTPELVTAVWVGYPNELRPMTTEFHGRPVTGGTIPAQIWKTFTKAARADEDEPDASFPPPPYMPAQSYRLARRGGWKLDNGYCPGTTLVAFFAGEEPQSEAECYQNEVRVPLVVGLGIAEARDRLALQPLSVDPIGIPAAAGARPGRVRRQEPAAGAFASAATPVRLWVTRPDPRYGVFPNLVGSSLVDATARLRFLKTPPNVERETGQRGIVVAQKPAPGVAAGPRMRVTLVVGR
jgi:membrane peptidoglycan carboxypeptidase